MTAGPRLGTLRLILWPTVITVLVSVARLVSEPYEIDGETAFNLIADLLYGILDPRIRYD